MSIPDDLVWYLVWRVGQEEGVASKTKLVKLLYLVDLEMVRRTGQAATQFRWRYYHYGPYAVEVESVLHRQEGASLRRRDARVGEFDTVTYRAAAYPPDTLLADRLRSVSDRICRDWGAENLNELLNHVYFETAPMKTARRGQYLDLSLVRLEPPKLSYAPLRPPDVRTELINRLPQWRQTFDEEFPVRDLFPPPRHEIAVPEAEGEERSLNGLRGSLSIDPAIEDELS